MSLEILRIVRNKQVKLKDFQHQIMKINNEDDNLIKLFVPNDNKKYFSVRKKGALNDN